MRKVILLDNELTMDLFCNDKFVTDVHQTKHPINVVSNGGTLATKKKASVDGYHRRVWYNKEAITNILSLANVATQYHVTYDSKNRDGFIVH